VLYGLLRWIAGIALHWFYADIRVVGRYKVPEGGPLIIAANHPNALVDALIAGWILPRRLSITAKATLLENPFTAMLFRAVGIVPLRRAKDEPKVATEDAPDPSRNREAFRRIIDVLAHDGVVLIFPEGKSHGDKLLAPLKTGLARFAIEARDQRMVHGINILPLGFKFQDKGAPGSVVVAEFGDPIALDEWKGGGAETLTAEIQRRLAAVANPSKMDSFESRAGDRSRSGLRGLVVEVTATFGEFAHRFLIERARARALSRSSDGDQPAMLTIIYGLIFLLAYYAVAAVLFGFIAGPVWALVIVLVLGTGAYWTAFKNHPRGY
jgi:1-acyl-sn-glycerol-3-phosphate acyltransferase